MRKQFSFKEFLLYAIRYWWITVICVAIGLGAAFCMSILGKKDKVRYEGQVELAGITTLYPDVPETEKETTSVYNTVRNRAISAMKLKSNVTELYKLLGKEYCSIMHIKDSDDGELEFRQSFAFSNTSIAFKVSFTMTGKRAKAAFCEKAVNEYLKIAVAAAKAGEAILSENEASIGLRDAERVAVQQETLLSTMVSNGLVGGACGFLGGVAISLIVYAVDPRMASYRDIAAVTGKRLLSVSGGETDESACPKIDSVMGDDRLLLIVGDASPCAYVAHLYGKYVAHENGALCVLFGSANENGPSSLAAFLGGQALGSCVEKEDGLSVLRAGNEKLTLADANKLAALAEQYGRVIFAKAYASDGVPAVLAKVANKIVYAYDYKTARVKSAYALAAEIGEPQKAAGACIENTGRGFVGTAAYIPEEEDASF